MARINKDFF